MKTEFEAKRAIDKYGDTVNRLCLVHLQNEYDAQDIFQNVFLKYVLCEKEFESTDHEKAWIIRVTINECKDLKKRFFSKHIDIDEIPETYLVQNDNLQSNIERKEIIKSVLKLPTKYREVIYLHYFEDYKATDIAKMLGKNENTIYTLLSRAKVLLKDILEVDENE